MPRGMAGKPAGTRQSVPGLPQGPSSTGETNQLLRAVRSGQMSADQLMQLLALMAQSRGVTRARAAPQARSGGTPPARGRRQRGNGSPLMSAMGG